MRLLFSARKYLIVFDRSSVIVIIVIIVTMIAVVCATLFRVHVFRSIMRPQLDNVKYKISLALCVKSFSGNLMSNDTRRSFFRDGSFGKGRSCP